MLGLRLITEETIEKDDLEKALVNVNWKKIFKYSKTYELSVETEE